MKADFLFGRVGTMPRKPSPEAKAYGERLRAVRTALGYDTMRAFAQETGVSEDRYRAWEDGNNAVPPWFIQELRRKHGVTHDFIYSGVSGGLPGDLLVALGLPIPTIKRA